MSSLERTLFTRRSVVLGLALGAAALAGGCQVRPLYADVSGTGASTDDDMRSIRVKFDRPDDNDETRVLQRIRNELIFAFTGGGEPAAPKYELNLLLSQREAEIGIQKFEDVPTTRLVSFVATFTLSDLAKQETVISATSFANASYDFSSQRFANIRAKRDAEDRAATAIANNIRTRVAAALASKK
ncbi:hypothetical protein HDIA_4634 [Hartmannibacter diazotrophicus]|uniref:LPS-assembly lipoprotein n=1 Tax=Hartmannibacter diazotrophicus TaxID=1482074 RepID=A0A2C9DEB2_9HYPH|nr:hypothetical protein [Hartmannibacter diazotrophicus]SON58175.1 hypothetical protein HDIA_4634 [Hartmannibacter diazotrophicus]